MKIQNKNKKKTTISKKLESNKIKLIFLILTLISYSKSQCLVDKCKTCPSPTVLTCTECEDDWYLREFTQGIAAYNECYSLKKLWLAIIGSLLFSMLLCCLCYWCYLMGKKTKLPPSMEVRDKMYTDTPKVVEKPIKTQPRPVA